MEDRAEDISHFDRFNALVDGGWLWRLSRLELRIWLVYLRHADSDGVAWPGGKRLGMLSGTPHNRSVRRVRTGLVRRGLMEILSHGGGRETAKVRVLTPPPDAANPGRRASSHPGRHRSSHPGPHRSSKHLIEQTTEHHMRDDVELKGMKGGNTLLAELAATGIAGANLRRLAATPGLTPLQIRWLAHEARQKKCGNPAGWIVTQLDAAIANGRLAEPRLLSPRQVSVLAGAGQLLSIAGHPVTGRVKWNDRGIYLRDPSDQNDTARVAARLLVPEAMTLAPPHQEVTAESFRAGLSPARSSSGLRTVRL